MPPAGGTVVTDRDGEDLAARLAAAVPADVALDPPTPAIGFVHRRLRDADVYFLANTSNIAAHRARAIRKPDRVGRVLGSDERRH